VSYQDEWSQEMLAATWGGFAIDMRDASDSFDRALVPFEYPNVDGAVHRDMGARARTTSCTLVFLPPNVLARVVKFLELTRDGIAYRLVHPLFGSYDARAENVTTQAEGEERDWVTISVTFVEESGTTSFADIASAADERAKVDTADADLTAALEDTGQESIVGARAVAQADEWESATSIDPRLINLQLAEVANAISADVATLELASSVRNYPVYLAMTDLHNNMRELAEVIIASQPTLTTYIVPASSPLLAISQELYGGDLALTRMGNLLELNVIRDPGFIHAGTILTVITP